MSKIVSCPSLPTSSALGCRLYCVALRLKPTRAQYRYRNRGFPENETPNEKRSERDATKKNKKNISTHFLTAGIFSQLFFSIFALFFSHTLYTSNCVSFFPSLSHFFFPPLTYCSSRYLRLLENLDFQRSRTPYTRRDQLEKCAECTRQLHSRQKIFYSACRDKTIHFGGRTHTHTHPPPLHNWEWGKMARRD